MMRMGHRATASPVALAMAWTMYGAGWTPVAPAIGCGVLVVATSTLPDWDHPRFKGRMHVGAALVRGTCHLGYMLRTDRDSDRGDLHRGPSHCVEWCLLAGLLAAVVALRMPAVSGWAWWIGAAVALGTTTHIAADLCTPSGVPVCATWNWLRHREVWRRHSLGLFTTDSAGERFLAIPLLFGVTGLMALGMVGLLGPVMGALTGWS